MTLTPGTRLGPYEIVSALGEGGMGQVYRAVDSRLKRQVAIKVLPPHLASDPDRLARFQREAEVLAALNHPHIAHLHGLEESGGTIALVMELVEGEDLRSRLSRGPLPLDEALVIAHQLADALETAHEQGIVHRDLKPANIRVRPDGAVKVLDFGLAKALDKSGESGGAGRPGGGPDLSASPTLTSPMTAAGIILGTAAYMSPEQAKGKRVDKRADIWAFGCVLYEMLTGTAPFASDSVAETLGLIFSREPDLALLPPATPPRVRQLLGRCLVKDPKQRLRDIGEARVVLDGAFDSPSSQTSTSPPAQLPSPTPRRRSPWMVIAAVTALSTIALAVPALRHMGETAPPVPQETRTEIVTPATSSPSSFALSPDGRQIVFVAAGPAGPQLWLRSLNTTTSAPLPGTEGATLPFWSPDSRSVGFFTSSALKTLDLGSGAPQTLAPVTVGTGGSWNSEGTILYAPTNGTTKAPLMRVAAGGGQPSAVTTVEAQQSGHRSPFFLPDGRRFLFTSTGTPDQNGIYLGSLDEPTITRLTPADSEGYWVPSAAQVGIGLPEGCLVWLRLGTRTLVAQPLDLRARRLTGAPVVIADGVVSEGLNSTTSINGVSASRAGHLAYRTGGVTQRQLRWFNRSGVELGTLGEPANGLRNPRVGLDGHTVVAERVIDGNEDLWLLEGSRANRLTFSDTNEAFPVWSPDGSRVAFSTGPRSAIDLFVKSATGDSPAEPLLVSPQSKIPFSWSFDGRFLLFSNYDPRTNADLYVVSMNGEHTASVVLQTPFRESQGMFSPDARWIAYMSDRTGRNEVYVRPFTAPGRGDAPESAGSDTQASGAGGIYPVWRPDGKELYYLNPAGSLMALSVAATAGRIELGEPHVLFETHVFGGGIDRQQGRNYDVTADGRFLINTALDAVTNPITLIQNWNPTAKP